MRPPKRVLFLDSFNGASGDMLLAALLDIGVDKNELLEKIGSLKLPKCESMSLPERVDLLNNFFSALEGIYKVFLGKRKDPTAWNTEVEAIRKWVANRASQA